MKRHPPDGSEADTSTQIITGTGAGLEPQKNATRAQVAQIMKNFDERILTAG